MIQVNQQQSTPVVKVTWIQYHSMPTNEMTSTKKYPTIQLLMFC